jgi:NAD(P)H-flavin reductase
MILPVPARIAEVTVESDDTRTFTLALEGSGRAFDAARPGQFVMLSVLGAGEAAFTLSSIARTGGPRRAAVVTVRRVGRLTGALFGLARGARVGVRGPYGHGFPDDDPACPTIYVAGGCGLAPLKTAIEVQLAERPAGTRIAVVYGARSPATRIHRAALGRWRTTPDLHLVECVEHPDPSWGEEVGSVPHFVAAAVATVGARRAAVCGPPAMLAATGARLEAAGVPAGAIHFAIERHMQCATGECGHCYVSHRYACTDGPVFTLAELRTLPDAAREVPPGA